MTSMRSDEMVRERERERAKSDDRLLKTGISAAATGAGVISGLGGKIASRIVPFLNEYIPIDLALKGISKISPELGNFLKGGMKQGLDLKEGLEFVKENMPEQQQPTKQKENIIEQYSPELFSFLEQEIKKGKTPQQAAALAQLPTSGKKFDSIIRKIEKDHKTNWSDIIQSVFGQGMAPVQANTQANTPAQEQTTQQAGGLDPEVAQIINAVSPIIQKYAPK